MTSFETGNLPTRHSRHAEYHHAPRNDLYHRPHSSGKLAFTVPDLRFEQSYLLSLQRFIQRDDAQRCVYIKGSEKLAQKGEKSSKDVAIAIAEKASGTEAELFSGGSLRMDWGGILYVTIRNQVLSPFAQGAILAVLTLYLRPFLRTLGARIRINALRSWQSLFPPIEPHIQGGAGWMRQQRREISMGGGGTNITLGK